MNLQQVVPPQRLPANGFNRRRGEREVSSRPENKSQSGKSNTGRSANTGTTTGGKVGGYGNASRDRLVYITTSLIGHHVEVQVKDGSVYSGIFHATNAEKDFGIILRMARLTKDGSSRGQKATADVSKAPSKTLIITAKDLVQVVAKGVSVTREELSHEVQHEKQQELMLDSSISQSRFVEMERELEPWVPDEHDPQCPELDNIFDGPWNRSWDQFETNEALFGVKSTFDEELYTTKLERGPNMEELEKKALRIAREIEGEETQDLHLAEERGNCLNEDLDIDEETRFSSVCRGKGVDDSGYEEQEDIVLDTRNTETFGSSDTVTKRSTDLTVGKSNDGAWTLSSSSSKDQVHSFQSSTGLDVCCSGSYDHAKQMASELPFKRSPVSDGESRVPEKSVGEQRPGDSNHAKELEDKKMLGEDFHLSKPEDLQSLSNVKKDGSDIGRVSADVLKGHEKMSLPGDQSDSAVSCKLQGETQSLNARGQLGSSTSSSTECSGSTPAFSGPGLSPSSSVGSLSSEKSTLNPHAKEFKLNPNAKSFIPSQTPVRPQSPVSDSSYYFPPNVSPVPHMPGMPVGIGIGPAYPGPQPVIFNPQIPPMQSPQGYFHANGPQYGPQMLVGHPRQQVLYMPSYQPEMPYKGREF